MKTDRKVLLSHENTDLFLASINLPISGFDINPIMLNCSYVGYNSLHLFAFEAQRGLAFELVYGGKYDCCDFDRGCEYGIEKLPICKPRIHLANARAVLLHVAKTLDYDIITSIKYLGIESVSQTNSFSIIGSGLKRKIKKFKETEDGSV